MAEQVRVRYAPSPTGNLHIGNARTALFNYLYARHFNGTFIIRVEDTDEKRNIAEGEKSQMTYLKWLGIHLDEGANIGGDYGPYRQSERIDIYNKYVNELLDRGLAYKCYMTEDELEEEREMQKAKGQVPKYSGAHRNLTEEQRKQYEDEGRHPSIRLRVPDNQTYTFCDIVRGNISFHSSDFGDWVIVKKNGMPTYNFAAAIDDHLMAITDVLRGEEHISNTPKQMMIYEAFGWDMPNFGHMTLIMNEQRKKLSKRDEHIMQFIEQYYNMGYLPEALFNFITLLGWSPVGEEEIFTKEQLIEMFDPDRLSTSPAVFDQNKLKWMNNEYIKNADTDRIVELALPYLIEAGRIPENPDEETREWARKLISLYQEQMNYAAEIVELTNLFFRESVTYDEQTMEVLREEQVPTVLQVFTEKLRQISSFDKDTIKDQLKATQKETGYKGKKLFMPVRAATTAQTHGPELPLAIELLGRDVVLNRLDSLLGKLES